MKIELVRNNNNSGWIELIINGNFIKNVKMTKDEFYNNTIQLELYDGLKDEEHTVYKTNIERNGKKINYLR